MVCVPLSMRDVSSNRCEFSVVVETPAKVTKDGT